MRKMPRLALTVFLICCLAAAPSAKSQAEAQQDPVVAFVGVNVVPMDRDRILEDQTVIVRAGRIVEIGPVAKIKIPPRARKIEARGKYLMPGLAEMHGHMPHPSLGEETANSFLLLFVANGVTTVRTMYGYNNSIPLRDKVNREEVLGPKLYVACPAMTGQAVQNPEQGEKLVRQYKNEGYDLLKIHEGLSLQTYDRIVKTANEVGIPYGGHIPDAVGLEHAIAMKQLSVEHLDGYLEALEADDSPVRKADEQTRDRELIDHLDERKLSKLVDDTRKAGVWNTPTMALWRTLYGDESINLLKQRPELKYVLPQIVNGWLRQHENIVATSPGADVGRRVLALRDKILRALRDAGAKLMLGSDAPQLYSVPGFSLQREMETLVKVGLTPYQVLEMGTSNPAVYLRALNEFGTVQVGRRADLILLDANPLVDVSNVRKRVGVMLRGRWFPEVELRRMLEVLAAKYAEKK